MAGRVLQVETLETRNLLAVDLVAEVTGLPSGVQVGSEIDFVLEVRNQGDADAIDARIEAAFPPGLDDVRWSRLASFPPVVHLDHLSGRDGIFLSGGL